MMRKKNKLIGVLLFVALLLFGCGNSGQSGDHPEQSEDIHSQSQTPPPLELKIGDDAIRAFTWGYSWSYYDLEEQSMAGIEAETIAIQEMVNLEKAWKVDKNVNTALEFGEPPLSYEVFVWDEAGNRKAFPGKLDLSQHKGKSIFEIRAHWEQGDSSYVFALDVE